MPYILVRHKVEDYAKWKTAFDGHGTSRKANGSQGVQLLRNADDPNELMVLMEWDEVGRAKQFAGSDDLRQAMAQAGIADHPDIYFLDEVERQPQ